MTEETKSEFEKLIDMDFTELNEAQFKKLLKLIWTETGRDKEVYYQLVQCKVLAEQYKVLMRIENKLS